MEMRCYSKVLRTSYKDHVTDEEVRAKIQQAIGPQENLLTIEKRRKLQWYGNASRSSGLAKTIYPGLLSAEDAYSVLLSDLAKAFRTMSSIRHTAASVGAKRQRRQSDRYTLPTFANAH